MLLSDDEEWKLWNAQGIDDMNQAEAIAFARAYADAILAKLAVKELPEPLMKTFRLGPMFTTEQMALRFAQGFAAGAASQLAEKPSGYLSQYNLEMLQQGYPQTIVMIEGAKRDVPLYTRREA